MISTPTAAAVVVHVPVPATPKRDVRPVRSTSPPAPSGSDVTSSPSPTAPKDGWFRAQISYYSYGRGTASGERYDANALTCAGIDRLPMGSRWMLRNIASGRTATIRINDRGAFERMGRTFDCTPGVWRAIGYSDTERRHRGVVTVEARRA